MGQGYLAPNVGSKEDPLYRQGTFEANVPIFGRALIDLGHYSPLGILGGEAGPTAGEQFAPQGMDIRRDPRV